MDASGCDCLQLEEVPDVYQQERQGRGKCPAFLGKAKPSRRLFQIRLQTKSSTVAKP